MPTVPQRSSESGESTAEEWASVKSPCGSSRSDNQAKRDSYVLVNKQRAALGRRQQVSLSNPSPRYRRRAGSSLRSGCLAASFQSLNQLIVGREINPAHRLQIKNCSAQITLMKNSSSLTGEISILMAPQEQLSKIMKLHPRCQSTAVYWGWEQWTPCSLAHTKTELVLLFFLFDSQLMHV